MELLVWLFVPFLFVAPTFLLTLLGRSRLRAHGEPMTRFKYVVTSLAIALTITVIMVVSLLLANDFTLILQLLGISIGGFAFGIVTKARCNDILGDNGRQRIWSLLALTPFTFFLLAAHPPLDRDRIEGRTPNQNFQRWAVFLGIVAIGFPIAFAVALIILGNANLQGMEF